MAAPMATRVYPPMAPPEAAKPMNLLSNELGEVSIKYHEVFGLDGL